MRHIELSAITKARLASFVVFPRLVKVAMGFSLVVPSCTALADEVVFNSLYGADVFAGIDFHQQYRDNVAYRSENVQASPVTIVSPALKWLAERDSFAFSASASLESGSFNESPEDDYTDTALSSNLAWRLDRRNMLRFQASRKSDHQERGRGFSAGSFLVDFKEPDTFDDELFGVNYRFGAKSSPGGFVVALKHLTREYDKQFTPPRFRDREEFSASGQLLWRTGGRSNAFFEARLIETDYAREVGFEQVSEGALDSSGYNYFVGFTWETSDKTESSIRLGQANKYFDSDAREDFSGISWEVAATWQPRVYSSFTLESSRSPVEPDGLGNFVDQVSNSLIWVHNWSERLETNLELSAVDRSFEGVGVNRDENLNVFEASVDYSIRRFIGVSLSYTYEDNGSNLEAFEYDSNILALSLKFGS